ncbi:MAG: hypothetical protein E7382_05475 [Clostridiales bacterium]|nr:hypothetical protein [Clostridiales bacterium]
MEEQKNYYVHYCTIGEDDVIEGSEGFAGPYTKEKAWKAMEAMDQELTIAGQHYYYNTCVVTEEEKLRMEKEDAELRYNFF